MGHGQVQAHGGIRVPGAFDVEADGVFKTVFLNGDFDQQGKIGKLSSPVSVFDERPADFGLGQGPERCGVLARDVGSVPGGQVVKQTHANGFPVSELFRCRPQFSEFSRVGLFKERVGQIPK